MPMQEIVHQSDLILYEIMRNPVLFTEFVENIDHTSRDEKFELTYYQKEYMLDFNDHVSICTSRSVGKTVSVSRRIIWALVFNLFPGEYITYLVPGKAQLDPVWVNLTRQFRTNSFLKHFLTGNSSGVNSSEFRITLANNSILLCRIAGQSGTGQNVIGLHTPLSFVDEGGYFPYAVFLEMNPGINTDTSGYQLTVSGVPSGMREKNVLYDVDQVSSIYSKHRNSAFQNPRFSEKDKINAIEQYGGEDSEDYIHYILGQHGKPVFALFDRSMMEISNNPVYRLVMNGTDIGEDISTYFTRINLFPGLPDKKDKCIIGIDLGYVEPTAIFIMYLDNYSRLRFHGKIQLTKVSYPIQEKLIDLLDSKFDPILIGMDRGGVGVPMVQKLQDGYEYAHKNYKKKLIPVDFSSSTVLGIDANGEEMKMKTKPFAVSVLQDYSNNHKIVYSSTDLELVTELERMTYSKNPTGEIVYRTMTMLGGKRGEDHFTSALLCASLAYYLNNEYIVLNQKKRKLAGFSWLR